jgi:hypothetical protein
MQICEKPPPFLELRSTNQVGTTQSSVHLCCFTDQNPAHILRYLPLLHRQPSNFVTFSPITPHPRFIFPLGYLHLLGELCYYSARGIEQEITMGGLNADYFSNFFLHINVIQQSANNNGTIRWIFRRRTKVADVSWLRRPEEQGNLREGSMGTDRILLKRYSEAEPSPKLYRMRIFAVNPVVARSRFWYFLKQLKKVVSWHCIRFQYSRYWSFSFIVISSPIRPILHLRHQSPHYRNLPLEKLSKPQSYVLEMNNIEENGDWLIACL